MMFTGVPLKDVLNLHPKDKCLGEVCPIHKPSRHVFRNRDQYFNGKHMLRVGDGHDNVPLNVVVDPDDYVLRSTGEAILRNSVECMICHDVIESTSRHDFVKCSCGAVFTDGGFDYVRQSVENSINKSVFFFLNDDKYGYTSQVGRILIKAW